mgnify:CR=1 FL=1
MINHSRTSNSPVSDRIEETFERFISTSLPQGWRFVVEGSSLSPPTHKMKKLSVLCPVFVRDLPAGKKALIHGERPDLETIRPFRYRVEVWNPANGVMVHHERRFTNPTTAAEEADKDLIDFPHALDTSALQGQLPHQRRPDITELWSQGPWIFGPDLCISSSLKTFEPDLEREFWTYSYSSEQYISDFPRLGYYKIEPAGQSNWRIINGGDDMGSKWVSVQGALFSCLYFDKVSTIFEVPGFCDESH